MSESASPAAAPAPARRDASTPSHLTALDGLRGLSVLLVLCDHMPEPANFAPLHAIWAVEHALKGGHLGVDIFFVLSGFLISRILIAEKAAYGHISLLRFYIKRSLRIFPIYYLAVFVSAFASPMPGGALASLLSYTFNYYHPFHPAPNPMEHSWSLSVEEQFYLVWPWLIAAVPLRFGPRVTGVLFPAIALASAVGISFGLLHDDRLSGELIYMSSATRMLSLSLGGWLAFLEFRASRSRSRRLETVGAEPSGDGGWSPWIAGGAVVLVAGKYLRDTPLIPTHGFYWVVALIGESLFSVGVVGLMVFGRGFACDAIRRVFSIAPARAVGRISYGLYLYHLPLLFALGLNPAKVEGHPTPVGDVVFSLALTFAVAIASWFVIERPFLAMKALLPPVRRPARSSSSNGPPSNAPLAESRGRL